MVVFGRDKTLKAGYCDSQPTSSLSRDHLAEAPFLPMADN